MFESKLSVLQNAKRSEINYDPFPHIIIKNCLPKEYYNLLESNYVSDEQLIKSFPERAGENNRVKFRFNDILNEKVSWHGSNHWLKFVNYHTSESFFRELIQLFGPEIRTLCPHVESRLQNTLEKVPVKVYEPFAKYNFDESKAIFFDGDIGINTISSKTSSVRSDHVDGLQKLFGGLLYFRRADDNSIGGDLSLSRLKYGEKSTLNKSSELNSDQVETRSTVKYQANTAVFWVNYPGAIHGVTQRGPSKVSRRLVYFSPRVDDKVIFPKGLYPNDWLDENNSTFSKIKSSLKKLIKKIF